MAAIQTWNGKNVSTTIVDGRVVKEMPVHQVGVIKREGPLVFDIWERVVTTLISHERDGQHTIPRVTSHHSYILNLFLSCPEAEEQIIPNMRSS